eukprot:4190054-Pleurochrysis_carterae.AAC.1
MHKRVLLLSSFETCLLVPCNTALYVRCLRRVVVLASVVFDKGPTALWPHSAHKLASDACRLLHELSQSLDYFRNAADPLPRGSIPISSVLRADYIGDHDRRKHCFAVRTANRSYIFCPDDEPPGNEADPRTSAYEWVQALVRAKARFLMGVADESFALTSESV